MKKIYSVRDVVTGQSTFIQLAHNQQAAIRDLFPVVSRAYPLKDVELFEIGTFDENTLKIVPCNPVLIPWSDYQFPVSQAENLSLLGDDVVKAFEQNNKHQTQKINVKSYDSLNK